MSVEYEGSRTCSYCLHHDNAVATLMKDEIGVTVVDEMGKVMEHWHRKRLKE